MECELYVELIIVLDRDTGYGFFYDTNSNGFTFKKERTRPIRC
jgi:hypothetical protein